MKISLFFPHNYTDLCRYLFKTNKIALLGQEWAVFKLGFPGKINQIFIDTHLFKGNYPDCIKVEGTYLNRSDWCPEIPSTWHNILQPSKVSSIFIYFVRYFLFVDYFLVFSSEEITRCKR